MGECVSAPLGYTYFNFHKRVGRVGSDRQTQTSCKIARQTQARKIESATLLITQANRIAVPLAWIQFCRKFLIAACEPRHRTGLIPGERRKPQGLFVRETGTQMESGFECDRANTFPTK